MLKGSRDVSDATRSAFRAQIVRCYAVGIAEA
jgi:hypothetical protein